MTESDPLLTIQEAAKIIGIELLDLQKHRLRGELMTERVDIRSCFVRQSEIDRFIAARTEADRMEEEPDFSATEDD